MTKIEITFNIALKVRQMILNSYQIKKVVLVKGQFGGEMSGELSCYVFIEKAFFCMPDWVQVDVKEVCVSEMGNPRECIEVRLS